MAAITVTTTINKDDTAASPRLNGEATNINGGTFIVNSDIRWEGGNFIVDGTTVWELPFTSSTGTVPTIGDIGTNTISSATALGELLRVWDNASKTPLTAGVPMPASGWVKLRSKTGTFSAGQEVTFPNGATIVISSAGKRSWINVVGGSSNSISTSPTGNFQTNGDWYELGVTSGLSNQQIQYPVEDICPAIQVETTPDSGVYEWWLNAGARWNTATKYVSQDLRGKFFGSSMTGIITLAQDGANACGYLAPAGCRIRIPNIILSYSSSTNWNINLNNNSLTSRFACNSVNYGTADLQFLSGSLRLSITNANSFKIKNSGLFDQIVFNNVQPLELDNVAVGLSGTLSQSAILVSNILDGASFTNITAVMYSSVTANNASLSLADCDDITVDAVDLRVFGGATTTTRGSPSSNALYATKVNNSTFSNLNLSGARVGLVDCDFININNIKYCDSLIGETAIANGQAAISLTQTSFISVDGYQVLYPSIPNQHPYVAIVELLSSDDVDIRNLGNKTNFIDCGTVNPTGVICSASLSKKINISRAYAINTRTAPFSTSGIIDQLFLTNVRSDYADTGQISGRNILIKGCSKTPYSLSQIGNHGRFWEDGFSSLTVGFITLCANDPTPLNINEYEIISGNPQFSSAGNIYFRTAGDRIVWKMPYFALGHKSLTSLSPTVVNASNFDFEFQFDKGAGMNGAWQIINTVNLTNVGAIDPNVGVKLWIRVTAKVSSATNRISYLRINTISDAASQLIEYPLPTANSAERTLTLTGIKPDSEVRIYDTAMNELAGVESSGASFSYTYQYSPATAVTVVIFNINYKAVRFEYTLPDINSDLPIQQSLDRVNNE